MSKLAAYYADFVRFIDGDPPPARDENVSPADIVRWLTRNKYPLLALADRAPDWLTQDATFRRALDAERAWYTTQRDEYVRVRTAWLAQGIECLMIKSAGNPPAFPHTSDNIDVAVVPERARAARDTLRRLGYVEVRNVEEPHKFLFRKFQDGRCVSAIHVHEQVIWFVGFMDETALWSRIRPADDDPCVNIPSPEDSILINLAHACYENKLLRLNDVVRIRHALRCTNGDLDWSYMERVAAGRGWLDGLAWLVLVFASVETQLFGSTRVSPAQLQRFEHIVRKHAGPRERLQRMRDSSTVELPLDLSYWLCKQLYYRKIVTDPTRTRIERWRDVLLTLLWGVKLKSGIRPQPGMVVSISGPDGSGKSAHARALTEAFRLCEIKAESFWSRGGSSGLAALVHRLRPPRRPAGNASQGDHLVRRRQRLTSPPLRFAWAWSVALDQIVTYVLRAQLPALFGRVVITDRYVYDTAVELDASLPDDARWSRWAIRALLGLTPRPRLAYMLDVAPDTARARKPDERWRADVAQERRQYARMAEWLGLRRVSTEGDFGEANDRLIREALMTYMAGFETWLNALFCANPSQKNAPDLIWVRGGGR